MKKTMLGIFGLVASLTLACSSGSGGGGTGGGGGFGNAGGSGTPAQSCATRCASLASDCGQDPGQCGQLCGAIDEAQLVCLESSNCDPQAAQACLASGSGGSSPGSGGSSPGSGGSSPGSGGSSAGGGAGLGGACDCPDEGDWVTCAGSGECSSGLTCVEYGGQKLCTEECTPDSCSGSMSCTALFVGSLEMGTYCWPE